MKLAYIATLPEYVEGVVNKVRERANAANDMGLDFDFYFINPYKELKENNFYLIKTHYIKNNFLNKVIFRLNIFNSIKNNINISKYNGIILRYPLVDNCFLSFINEYGNKLITEHHTNEIWELVSVGRFVDYARAIIEILFSRFFLNRVKGIIGVTKEIVDIELKKINKKKPVNVISNGINVDSVNFTKFKRFDGNTLDIIFVASLFSPWHGLDKVLTGLKNYRGTTKVNLHLVGQVSKGGKSLIKTIKNENVDIILHGFIYGNRLDRLFEASNLAISSLAIANIRNMKEACPIKTREYIARGIPFIYGYRDTDLRGDEVFAMKIGNKFDVEKIIDFAITVSKIKDLSSIMRNFAIEKLDWKIKINQMYRFAKETLGS